MEREEMIQVLEEIIRDPETNPTARVTAIRALKEFPKPPALDESLEQRGQRVADDGTGSPRQPTAEG